MIRFRKCTLTEVENAVCLYYDINKEQLSNKNRKAELISARRMFCYVSKQLTGKSYRLIGIRIGKDHATALHHDKKMRYRKFWSADDEIAYSHITASLLGNTSNPWAVMYSNLGRGFLKTLTTDFKWGIQGLSSQTYSQ